MNTKGVKIVDETPCLWQSKISFRCSCILELLLFHKQLSLTTSSLNEFKSHSGMNVVSDFMMAL